MSISCGDIIAAVEQLAAPGLAEEWDNVGLQVGDKAQQVTKIMLALTPTEQAVAAAKEQQADMLITHHPLIFKPIKKVTTDSATGRAIIELITNHISLYCAHTSLDAAKGGVNDVLAEALGLVDVEVLEECVLAAQWYKLVVYVPQDYEDTVRQALCQAGAGQIGEGYSCCTFRSAGIGTFIPQVGADPYIGKVGEVSHAEEFRLETVVDGQHLRQAIDAMLQVHPYEKAAYDVFRLELPGQAAGIGRLGRLPVEMTLQQFLVEISNKLHIPHLSYQGDLSQRIKTVALCGGSGAGYLSLANSKGADVYLTGDVKYHDGQLAEELGIALIDAGHFATERLILPVLSCYLQHQLGLSAEQIVVWEKEEDLLKHFVRE